MKIGQTMSNLVTNSKRTVLILTCNELIPLLFLYIKEEHPKHTIAMMEEWGRVWFPAEARQVFGWAPPKNERCLVIYKTTACHPIFSTS
jgi:hypothetical protein